METVSLILPSFRRAELLDLTLSSIEKQKLDVVLEIIVVNDGVEDDTKAVCDKHNSLTIRYYFSGQRNAKTDKRRVAGFALNIGVQKSTGNILILSCAEIYHLNDCISQIVAPLMNDKKALTTPRFMYFDDSGGYSSYIHQLVHCQGCPKFKDRPTDVGWNTAKNIYGVKMPYLMGMWRNEYFSIGGYDEDFIGYASDDNDFVERVLANGCHYLYTDAQIVHLFHGATCDSFADPENKDWVYNQRLLNERRGTIIRNKNKEWGVI